MHNWETNQRPSDEHPDANIFVCVRWICICYDCIYHPDWFNSSAVFNCMLLLGNAHSASGSWSRQNTMKIETLVWKKKQTLKCCCSSHMPNLSHNSQGQPTLVLLTSFRDVMPRRHDVMWRHDVTWRHAMVSICSLKWKTKSWILRFWPGDLDLWPMTFTVMSNPSKISSRSIPVQPVPDLWSYVKRFSRESANRQTDTHGLDRFYNLDCWRRR